MSAARALGRPRQSEGGLSRADVLTTALKILSADGERGMTMRALAKSLSVTPMALYHHVGNRDELIAALIEHVFGQIVSAVSKDLSPSAQIEALLSTYCQRATDHPELILAVFRDPNALAGPLGDLTENLRSNLHMMGVPLADVSLCLGMLVDYTHGYAISWIAAQDEPKGEEHQKTYAQNIQFLIEMVKRELKART